MSIERRATAAKRKAEYFKRNFVGVSDELIADAKRRAAAVPRDLTAALCGDPLPGRSALDRRQSA